MDKVLKEIKKIDTTNRANSKPLNEVFDMTPEQIIAWSMDMGKAKDTSENE